MVRPNRSRASLAVALALGLAGFATVPGCEIITNFNRNLIDAGGTEEDAALFDAEYPDGSPADANQPPSEASANDSSQPGDAGTDSAVADAGDAQTLDANVPDTSELDSNVPDTSVVDSNVPDTSDANVADANDASVPEGDASDDGATE
jgi:hypothetical protein